MFQQTIYHLHINRASPQCFNRTQLTKRQDDFFAHMVKKFPDIERGESDSVTGRR